MVKPTQATHILKYQHMVYKPDILYNKIELLVLLNKSLAHLILDDFLMCSSS